MKRANCVQSVSEDCCILCKSSVDDGQRLGEKRTLDDVTIHYFCALFASGLHQNGERDAEGIWGFLLDDIRGEARRARRLTCAFCKQCGASVGCLVKSCHSAFHFPCGLDNGVLNQYCGSFSSYCEKHRLCQEAPDRKPSVCAVDTCAVCLCSIEPMPSVKVLMVPCCQNSYIHRKCIQQQALASGLHFFKCPLCNNKELFTAEMLKFGIYIPDRDASWEQEANAFNDLLERHCFCDVAKCRCKFGRSYNEVDSCWEIMLCDSCGSEGTHLACSGLKTAMDDWLCNACDAVFVKVLKEKERKRKNSEKRKLSAVLSGSAASSSYRNGRRVCPRIVEPESCDVELQDHSLLSASSSNDAPHRSVDNPYKPRPRCLSRYVQRHKKVGSGVPDNRPRWVKSLLNDDIHTGRNLGAKLSFMHTSESESQE